MPISFQTVVVVSVVTAAHAGALVALKPVSEETANFFSELKLDAFVEEVLVKEADPRGKVPETAEERPENLEKPTMEEGASESESASIAEAGTIETGVGIERQVTEEKESVTAVTDVRAFAGRIDEPVLRDYSEAEETKLKEKVAALPVEPKKISPPTVPKEEPKSLGPLQVREILPRSGS